MKKYIIRDFFEDLKLRNYNWKNTNFEFAIIYFCAYFVWSWILFSKGVSKFEWKAAVICLAILLPMLFTYYSICTHSPKLGKMMYLCPMDEKERKEYIYGSYFFRIGFLMIIAVLGLCIVISISYCDIFSSLQILLNHAMTVVLVSSIQKKENKGSNINVIAVFIFIAALISNIVEYGIVMDEEPDIMVKAILFLVFCLIQIPLEIAYIKNIKKELRNSIFYEKKYE